jgi:hypothetical protein
MANAWISHLKSFYAKNKKTMSYAQAMKAARASYKPKGKATKEEPKTKKTKKKRQKK